MNDSRMRSVYDRLTSAAWPAVKAFLAGCRSRRRLEYIAGVVVVVAIGGGAWLASSGDWRIVANVFTFEAKPTDDVRPTSPAAKSIAAGRYRVNVEIDPAIPKVGLNKIVIAIADAEGKPVPGAKVRAVGTMPAMGAMPAMHAPAELAETGPGRHKGAFDLSMEGAWPLTVEIESAALGRAELSFDMGTSRKGLRLAGATPAEGGARSASPQTPAAGGVMIVDEPRRQLIGVTTGIVERAPMRRDIRAVGRVVYDETRLHDVTLKFDAWIGDLQANAVGMSVRKGQPLFSVYSPELLIAQKDLLLTLKSMRQDRRAAARNGIESESRDTILVEAARQRFRLMDIAPGLVRDIESSGRSRDYLPVLSPVGGTVVEKNVVAGTAMKRGDRLLRIADLARVWVEAQVYEDDLPFVREGLATTVTLTHMPGTQRQALVSYVYPYLTDGSRTGRIRVELDNRDGSLKPDMYAEMRLQVDLGVRLRVPYDAVLYAGDTRIAFVDLGEGRLQPRQVKVGARDGDFVEIVDGLAEGERIVTSANFLIASESRLKSAVRQW